MGKCLLFPEGIRTLVSRFRGGDGRLPMALGAGRTTDALPREAGAVELSPSPQTGAVAWSGEKQRGLDDRVVERSQAAATATRVQRHPLRKTPAFYTSAVLVVKRKTQQFVIFRQNGAIVVVAV